MKAFIVYQKDEVLVFICGPAKKEKGRKTNIYMVRRNDKMGYGHLLGLIKFDGGWRQYVFEPAENTKWSSGCIDRISLFCKLKTKAWRGRLK